MRTTLMLALCVAFLGVGCATFQGGRHGRHSLPGELSEEEMAHAAALAHYCRARIIERDLGWKAPETVEEYAAALEFDPDRPRLYTKTAALYIHHGEPARAIEILQRALRGDRRNAKLHANLAVAYEAGQEPDKAVRHYKAAIRISPETAAYYSRLAGLHFRQERDAAALRLLDKGMDIAKPRSALVTACYSAGTQFLAAENIVRAIPCFDLVVRHEPGTAARLRLLMGELHEKVGHSKEAIFNYTLATLAPSPAPESFLRLASLYMDTEPGKAIETLGSGNAMMPDDPRLIFALGFAHAFRDEFKDAADAFQRVEEIVERAPGILTLGDKFYLYYGMACERSGREAEAERVFGQGLARYPDAHRILNYLAYMWAEKGAHLDESLEYINRAIELAPDNGAYIDTLGWIYYKMEKYSDALVQIRRSRELLDDDPTVIDHLGDVYEALGQMVHAISAWKQSLLLDPENDTVAEKLQKHGVDAEAIRGRARGNIPAPRATEED
ncbi:MAG: tetratricopeptide repeat protein [Lentisphaerae bacterium]|nr:tetratricopeptide repeat protein [Lentisphaerota bacterium]